MPGYTTVLFPSGIGAAFKPAYDEASDFWNSVVLTGADPLTFKNGLDVSKTQCGIDYQFPKGYTLEGLTIFASSPAIDGPGQILGRAGPCYLERGSTYPRLGIMEFDIADSQNLLDEGQFAAVVIHEMGHVLGIGGLWPALGVLQNPCPLFRPTCNGRDPRYTGKNGVEGFKQLNPPSEIGDLPPVANTGGMGTANAHWRESTFDNELMSGYLNSGRVNPLSIMTVMSMIDLGYTVDFSQAQDYQIPEVDAERDISDRRQLIGDILFFDLDADVNADLPEIGGGSHSDQFMVVLFMMVAGFIALGALQMYLFKGTKKEIARIQNKRLQVSNANPMHLNELA